MCVAIIPARGGSKRVPRKNVVEVGGRPMLTHPIGAARESALFDTVYVSTEDAEIAAVVRDAGATVIARPAEIAQDRSTVVQVCLHALDEIEQTMGPVAVFCCIYATAIFVTADDLRDSQAQLDQEPVADVVMGVSEYGKHPVQALKQEGAYATRMWPEYDGLQSQSYPHLVASNGTLYWSRTDAFRETRSFYAKRLKVYEIPRWRAVDIDTPDDLELARYLMNRKRDG